MNGGSSKRDQALLLSREEMIRQGRIVDVAQAALADIVSVRSFPNSHRDGLQGRPIDLAVASHDGLIVAEAAVARHAGGGDKSEATGP